jgi:hypothetical protein
MSETPKFTVIDRRKYKAEEEQENAQTTVTEPKPAPELEERNSGPQLVVNDSKQEAKPAPASAPQSAFDEESAEGMPPAPTTEESLVQQTAYEASAQRVEDLLRAQNPGMGATPPVTFEHLVQQFYVSAMIQMGAGTQEGQRPRVDIVGARTTIDLLGVLGEKTRGNLTDAEERMLESVLFEVRMAFLELTSMINLQGVPPVPPPPGKR